MTQGHVKKKNTRRGRRSGGCLRVALDWEEVVSGRIREVWEEVDLAEFLNSLDRLAGDELDVAAGNAEVVEFAVGQAAQLVHGIAVAAPVAVVADQVHGSSRFVEVRLFRFA